MNVILLGFPGAGKGTQAKVLEGKYGFVHISTGDLIRKEVASKSELGERLSEIIKNGSLVSDEIVTEILIKNLNGKTQNIVFDGFPRTLRQAESLDNYLREQGKKIDEVVLIELPEEEVLKRLTSRRVCKLCGAIYNIYSEDFKDFCVKCGGQLITRSDDTLQSAKRRLDVFREETKPLLSYYGSTIGVKKIDGGKTIEEVSSSIAEVLKL
ncbi:MAG: adenylate kinase [Elusimicrobiota bacterium]|jgi:adenylate kinase|nr:adenylate kinase [Elusimicrobiota bacterium]